MGLCELEIVSLYPIVRSALCIVEFSVQADARKISFPRERS